MLSPSGIYLRKNARTKYMAILKSACQQFLKYGYTRTNMEKIAKEAGVSKQTVYSYFTNKDVLFCKMIEAECARHRPANLLLEKYSLRPEDTLYHIGHGFVDMISSPRGIAIHKLVMAEVDRHPHIAQLFYESGPLSMQALLLDYFSKKVELGIFVIDDIEAAASNFYALVKGRYHLRMQLKIKPAPSKKEVDKHIRDVVKVFLKIYGA